METYIRYLNYTIFKKPTSFQAEGKNISYKEIKIRLVLETKQNILLQNSTFPMWKRKALNI